MTIPLLCIIPLAYLIGSIPFGLIVGKVKGIDPRTAGSGNIGATNLGRLLGRKYFWLVFGLDLLKGMLPTLAAGAVIGFRIGDRQSCLLWIAAAAAAPAGTRVQRVSKIQGGQGSRHRRRGHARSLSVLHAGVRTGTGGFSDRAVHDAIHERGVDPRVRYRFPRRTWPSDGAVGR